MLGDPYRLGVLDFFAQDRLRTKSVLLACSFVYESDHMGGDFFLAGDVISIDGVPFRGRGTF